jgi:hypothetical protein
MATDRRQLAGTGTQTAALAFGGRTTVVQSATEEYNGATWASNPTGLNTARHSLAAAGTQTCRFSFWW